MPLEGRPTISLYFASMRVQGMPTGLALVCYPGNIREIPAASTSSISGWKLRHSACSDEMISVRHHTLPYHKYTGTVWLMERSDCPPTPYVHLLSLPREACFQFLTRRLILLLFLPLYTHPPGCSYQVVNFEAIMERTPCSFFSHHPDHPGGPINSCYKVCVCHIIYFFVQTIWFLYF